MNGSGDPHTPGRTVPRNARLRRSTLACQRCRRRKQKCDLKYPRCSTCESAQVPCLTYDSEKQSEIPRGYVSILEDEIGKLRSELEDLRTSRSSFDHQISGTTAVADIAPMASPDRGMRMEASTIGTMDTPSSDPQEMVRSMGLVLLESSNQPRFMGTSSGVTFAKMVLAAIKDDWSVGVVRSPDRSSKSRLPSAPSAPMAASLPPQHAAKHITDVYFTYRTAHLHILQRSEVDEIMDRVYTAVESSYDGGTQHAAPSDLFICYMIFSIGLFSMPIAGAARPPQSEGCFNSALQYVDGLLSCASSDLQTLKVVLFLAQYVALNPSRGSLWQLAGMALRLCIDLGLHWETSAVLNMPPHLLNERRRLYWATYRLERFLCITLGRPFSIAELSMNTGLADPYASSTAVTMTGATPASEAVQLEIHHQRVENHIIKLYRLESEIKHVLYHQLQGSTLAYPRPNYQLWFRDIQSRLREWQDSIPAYETSDSESIYSQKSWWEAQWCSSLLMLHRPSVQIPVPTLESLQTCFDAACRSVAAIKTLQRGGKIDMIWASVHHLFMAGLTMVYCIWQSPEVRESASVIDVMTSCQDCASTLTAMTERFSEAAGCRDAFEGLSSATLKWLMRNNESDRQDTTMFSNEIDALRDLAPFSTVRWQADEPASIFPDEPFDLFRVSEMLPPDALDGL